MTVLRDAIIKADLAKLADLRDLYNAKERWMPHEAAWFFNMAARGIKAEPPPCRCCGAGGGGWGDAEMCESCYAEYVADMAARDEEQRMEMDEEYDRRVDQMLSDAAAEHETPKGA